MVRGDFKSSLTSSAVYVLSSVLEFNAIVTQPIVMRMRAGTSYLSVIYSPSMRYEKIMVPAMLLVVLAASRVGSRYLTR